MIIIIIIKNQIIKIHIINKIFHNNQHKTSKMILIKNQT
jgi:hypothetical protein